MNKINIKKLTFLAMMLCIALVLGYLEAIIPINIGIPGIKLGLANIVSLIVLFSLGWKEGFIVGFLRVILVGLLFSDLSVIIYSLTGFILSYFTMTLLYNFKAFSVILVSVVGALCHNLGQFAIASLLIGFRVMIIYLPFLLVAALFSGLLTGFLSSIILRKLGSIMSNFS